MSCWSVLSERKAACSADSFYSGVDVWLKRPNVVNKRLLGAITVLSNEDEEAKKRPSSTEDSDDVVRGRQVVHALVRLYCEERRREVDSSDERAEHELPEGGVAKVKGVLRQLLPKMRSSSKGWEAVLIDQDNRSVIFCPLTSLKPPSSIPECSYKLQLSPATVCKDHASASRISLLVRRPLTSTAAAADHLATVTMDTCTTNGVTVPTREWLGSTLLLKVAQWCEESDQKYLMDGQSPKSRQRGEPLVPLGRYSQLYSELKEKYGPTLVQNWPEATDPNKFVYEDIAIATYLLVLWEEEREKLGLKEKQSFIDLGCGNGLLVYLLTSEGHTGKGIDLRERKIWKMFEGKVHLEVCSLEPSETTLYPDYDWLLGNHSDELTPWIPVMASRSSFTTRYFVLPCCSHDFNKKFTRPTTRKSQYQCYLDYVCQIGEKMGFIVKEDTLRIPSSKRVCQVGMERTYPRSQEGVVDERRRAFLIERCGSRPGGSEREDHTHLDSVQGKGGDVIENKCDIMPTYPLNQSGDLDGTCDGQVMTGETNYARNVVSSNIQHHHWQHPPLPGNCSSVSSSPHPITNLSLTGEIEESRRNVASPLSLSPLDSAWGAGFKPRDANEITRNCSRVNVEVKKVIVDTLTQRLLQTENYTTLRSEAIQQPVDTVSLQAREKSAAENQEEGTFSGENESGKDSFFLGRDSEAKLKYSPRVCVGERDSSSVCISTKKEEEEESLNKTSSLTRASYGVEGCERVTWWNLGGKIHLSEAAAMFDSEVLSQLKKEFGGLQTLLRNEHQIFKVQGGYIQLRDWSQFEQSPRKPPKPLSQNQKQAKSLLFKTKLCWFHLSHPQGCPRSSRDCPYAHGEEEQRERPNFREVLDCSERIVSLS